MNQSIPQPIVNSGIPATSITPGQIASVNPLQARSALAPAGIVPLSVNPGVVPVAASTPGLAPVGGLIQSVPVPPPTTLFHQYLVIILDQLESQFPHQF